MKKKTKKQLAEELNEMQEAWRETHAALHNDKRVKLGRLKTLGKTLAVYDRMMEVEGLLLETGSKLGVELEGVNVRDEVHDLFPRAISGWETGLSESSEELLGLLGDLAEDYVHANSLAHAACGTYPVEHPEETNTHNTSEETRIGS